MIKITHVGHACFEIGNDSEKLVVDPFDDSIGYGRLDLTANYLLVSHEHYDHNFRDGVKLLLNSGTFSVRTVDSFHDDVNGTKRGSNLIHIIETDGVTICHLGDLGQVLSDEQVAEIGKVDVLLIPVGGTYTIDAQQAREVVRQLKPQITIPMHYKTPKTNLDIAPVDEFLKLMTENGVPVQTLGTNELTFSPDLSGVIVI